MLLPTVQALFATKADDSRFTVIGLINQLSDGVSVNPLRLPSNTHGNSFFGILSLVE